MNKPVRRVRRFIKRKGGGKSRGKGRQRYLCLEQMPDQQVSTVFFGGKAGGGRTTGKGKGRKKNPIGPDGTVMTCSICGSEDHFRALCPRATSGTHMCLPAGGGGDGSYWAVTDATPHPAQVDNGPLSNILEASQIQTTSFQVMFSEIVTTQKQNAIARGEEAYLPRWEVQNVPTP